MHKQKSIKKSPLAAGLKLFSWRRIVETGEIMLRREIYVQFSYWIPDIDISDI
ncbi:hypothetical protein [Massilia sp. MS-15]|uniref:hypothetical protein n=1 Tax=Massilia sp. MS-15 TaxID=2878200 RepID=UPI001CD66199|nr:hypothetical protein [Massilia sp. MS-15]